jgi:hypothetical protein
MFKMSDQGIVVHQGSRTDPARLRGECGTVCTRASKIAVSDDPVLGFTAVQWTARPAMKAGKGVALPIESDENSGHSLCLDPRYTWQVEAQAR